MTATARKLAILIYRALAHLEEARAKFEAAALKPGDRAQSAFR